MLPTPSESRLPVILVGTDDDREMYAFALRFHGFDPIEFSEANPAFTWATEGDPSIVIADAPVPERGAFELAQRLRQDTRTAAIPIIILSANGFAQPQVRAAAREAGVDLVLIKPCLPTV